jgi:hypothetical protein
MKFCTIALFSLVHGLQITQQPYKLNTDTSAYYVQKRPAYQIDYHLIQTNLEPFKSFPDRLQQTLVTKYSYNITEAFNDSGLFSKPLIHPGTARVVIVSPDEFTLLQTVGITMKEVVDIAYNNYIAYTIMRAECFGRQDEQGESVAFLRLSARTWNNIRRDVEGLWLKKGGEAGKFDKDAWWPHMTLGESTPNYFNNDLVGQQEGCFADVIVGNPWESMREL